MQSNVPDHKGECSPVWLNTSQVDNRLDGGVTGFFRLIKPFWVFNIRYGPVFHGIIKNGIVESSSKG